MSVIGGLACEYEENGQEMMNVREILREYQYLGSRIYQKHELLEKTLCLLFSLLRL